MSDKTRIFPNNYSVYCDVYDCRNRATHYIGRPDATKAATFKLCDECIKAALSDLEPKHQEYVTNSQGQQVNTSQAQEQAESAQALANVRAEENRVEQAQEVSQPAETKETTEIEEEQAERLEQNHEQSTMEVKGEIRIPPYEKLRATLQEKTVKDLKALAKDQNIDKYYDMDKGELVEALIDKKGTLANGTEKK